ncbi:MAG: glycosyl hydrolase family 18 protein [Eubacteriales bacterium]|nr:glycosyl hydrolase family 18 protein [Eubacteriales bacterium]
MKKKMRPVLTVLLLIVLVAIAGMGYLLIRKYMPTRQKMNLSEYYGEIAEDQGIVIVGTEILEARALVSGEMTEDTVYLPLDAVRSNLNQRFYWDSEGGQILYATPSELLKVPAQQEAGGDVWQQGENIYLKLAYVHQYTDMDVTLLAEPNRIAIQKDFTDVNSVIATKNAYVRYRGGIKSLVLTKVSTGDRMTLLEELENWYRVGTADGFVGYIDKKSVSDPEKVTVEREFQREEYQYLTMEEKVNLVWHQVTVKEANAGLADAIKDMTGVNVISPTWYYVTDNSGNIADLSSADYVAAAHAAGLKVWGLIDNFTGEITTETMLSSTSARQNLISQLIASATNVGLDGINVDFEQLSEGSGIHFLEFLRELSIECHKNQLVLSVDNPVPADFTSHYDRAEQGRVVDYIIIMGYDEHYSGSVEAGSVASLPWVEQGIQDTLEEVPAERVINAIPFYTRVWKTQAGTLSSEAVGMSRAAELVAENHAETYWDTNVLQTVASYETAEASYKIWMEDQASIAEKVKLIPKYQLAGVAAWKLGLEDSSIWATITENLS